MTSHRSHRPRLAPLAAAGDLRRGDARARAGVRRPHRAAAAVHRRSACRSTAWRSSATSSVPVLAYAARPPLSLRPLRPAATPSARRSSPAGSPPSSSGTAPPCALLALPRRARLPALGPAPLRGPRATCCSSAGDGSFTAPCACRAAASSSSAGAPRRSRSRSRCACTTGTASTSSVTSPLPGEDIGGRGADPSSAPPSARSTTCRGCSSSGRVDDIMLAASAQSWRVELIDRLAGSRPRAHQRAAAAGAVREPDRPHALPLGPGPPADRGGARDRVARASADETAPRPRVRNPAARRRSRCRWRPSRSSVRLTSAGRCSTASAASASRQRQFTLLKFRTMREDAERDTGEVLAVEDDPR